MAMASLQLPPPILGRPARNGCTGRRPRMVVVSCKHTQVNYSLLLTTLLQSADAQEEARLTSRISRRDTLSYMSSAFLATFLVADRAEARTSRKENKKKVMEKLEKIREKALRPRGKNGEAGKDEGKEPVVNLLIPPKFFETPI